MHQNEMINEEQLERIQNDDELEQLILAESLVRIPETRDLEVAQSVGGQIDLDREHEVSDEKPQRHPG